MKRRAFLASAGLAATASTFPSPAISKGIRELTLVTSYPPIRFQDLLVETLNKAFSGHFKVRVFPAGELVGPFEVFDAVSEGIADIYFSNEYYWRERAPAFQFFTSIPYGLTANEMDAWIYRGGGQELWDELSAEFNLKPFLAGNTGVQMGGWYNKEMPSAESFKDLRIRIPGLGGEIMRRLGATVVALPPGEIVPAMESGAIDAAEYVGPDLDFTIGLHKVGKYYYYPGVHEPGTANAVAVNRKLWQGLSSEDRGLIETTLAGYHTLFRAEFFVAQIEYLKVLVDDHRVSLRSFDDDTLSAFGRASNELVSEIGSNDAFSRRVHESFTKFRSAASQWTEISERAYLNAREAHSRI